MPRDFFDPTRAQHNVVLIDAVTLREAERLIQSCEHCHPEDADIPFDWILDRVTGSDPSVTDYVLEEPALVSEQPGGSRFTSGQNPIPLITSVSKGRI